MSQVECSADAFSFLLPQAVAGALRKGDAILLTVGQAEEEERVRCTITKIGTFLSGKGVRIEAETKPAPVMALLPSHIGDLQLIWYQKREKTKRET